MGRLIKAKDVVPATRPSRQSKFKLQSPALKRMLEWLAEADKLGELPVGEVFEFDKHDDLDPYYKGNKDPVGSAITVIRGIVRTFRRVKAVVVKRKYAGKIYVGAADAFDR